jgi:hypothetical protein
MAETVNVIWGNREAEYFSREGWTDFRARSFFCLSGKSLATKIAKNSLFYSSNFSAVIPEAQRSGEPGIPFCDGDDAVRPPCEWRGRRMG